MASLLVADLADNALYKHLLVVDPMKPTTWRVKTVLGHEKSLDDSEEARRFLDDITSSLKLTLDCIFLSVAQDADGQHRFVCLDDVRRFLLEGNRDESDKLTLRAESEVEAASSRNSTSMLFARPQVLSEQPGSPRVVDCDDTKRCDDIPPLATLAALGGRDSYCPKSSIWGTNYDVIPDLSLGVTQRLILCDEATLKRNLPSERIFEYLKLIVNCHESKVSPGKYKIGSCSSGVHPRVICEAVHTWHAGDGGVRALNQKNDAIQEAIWENLQQGTVAVHCLAGIHRAACIVACHYLWRHYTLGQSEIPSNTAEIYRRLKACRPHVDPAYAHVLRSYETHLKSKHGAT